MVVYVKIHKLEEIILVMVSMETVIMQSKLLSWFFLDCCWVIVFIELSFMDETVLILNRTVCFVASADTSDGRWLMVTDNDDNDW